ncbi:unnamed protein product [Amoebophrya sp. A120]|nr:unnamed protein product [Amoebophrya sp. A120]|eukprot:GSA120T00013711001.1
MSQGDNIQQTNNDNYLNQQEVLGLMQTTSQHGHEDLLPQAEKVKVDGSPPGDDGEAAGALPRGSTLVRNEDNLLRDGTVGDEALPLKMSTSEADSPSRSSQEASFLLAV